MLNIEQHRRSRESLSVGSLALVLGLTGWSALSNKSEASERIVVDGPKGLEVVRGCNSVSLWQQALGLRQRLLKENPEFASVLSPDEQQGWEAEVRRRCEVSPSTATPASCAEQYVEKRIRFLEAGFVWDNFQSYWGTWADPFGREVQIGTSTEGGVRSFVLWIAKDGNGPHIELKGEARGSGDSYVWPGFPNEPPCRIRFEFNDRNLFVTVDGCREQAGVGPEVELGGTFRKMGLASLW